MIKKILIGLAMLVGLGGCSAEDGQYFEEIETGTVEQGLNFPAFPGFNVFPDDYRIKFTCGSSISSVCTPATAYATQLATLTDGAQQQFPVDQRLQVSPFFSGTDIVVNVDTQALCPPGQTLFCWGLPEYFSISRFTATATIPGSGGAKKTRTLTLFINTNALASKVAVSGISQDRLVKAAVCRAAWAVASAHVTPSSTACNNDTGSVGWQTFNSFWSTQYETFPTAEWITRGGAMRSLDASQNPDPFRGATDLQ